MDSSFGTLRFDPALSKISLGIKKLDHRVKGHTRESRTSQRSGKMAKKSDFAGAGSFANWLYSRGKNFLIFFYPFCATF
jgi:hypothetical protein